MRGRGSVPARQPSCRPCRPAGERQHVRVVLISQLVVTLCARYNRSTIQILHGTSHIKITMSHLESRCLAHADFLGESLDLVHHHSGKNDVLFCGQRKLVRNGFELSCYSMALRRCVHMISTEAGGTPATSVLGGRNAKWRMHARRGRKQ